MKTLVFVFAVLFAGGFAAASPVDLTLTASIPTVMELLLNGGSEDVVYDVDLEETSWQTAATMSVSANKPFTVTVTSANEFRLVNENHLLAGGSFEEPSLLVSYGIRYDGGVRAPDGDTITDFLHVPTFGQIISQNWGAGKTGEVDINLNSTVSAPGTWEDELTFTLTAL